MSISSSVGSKLLYLLDSLHLLLPPLRRRPRTSLHQSPRRSRPLLRLPNPTRPLLSQSKRRASNLTIFVFTLSHHSRENAPAEAPPAEPAAEPAPEAVAEPAPEPPKEAKVSLHVPFCL